MMGEQMHTRPARCKICRKTEDSSFSEEKEAKRLLCLAAGRSYVRPQRRTSTRVWVERNWLQRRTLGIAASVKATWENNLAPSRQPGRGVGAGAAMDLCVGGFAMPSTLPARQISEHIMTARNIFVTSGTR
jgi:hypothetical protein